MVVVLLFKLSETNVVQGCAGILRCWGVGGGVTTLFGRVDCGVHDFSCLCVTLAARLLSRHLSLGCMNTTSVGITDADLSLGCMNTTSAGTQILYGTSIYIEYSLPYDSPISCIYV